MKNISRKSERILFKIVGVWQILQGVFTLIYYSILNKASTATTLYAFLNNEHDAVLVMTIINIFGSLLIGLGIVNLVVVKNYMKDTSLTKTGYWILINSFFSYFIFDIISLVFGMSALVIYFAKNKTIKQFMLVQDL